MDKFINRKDAGKKLAVLLLKEVPGLVNAIILALPRGGVVVAAEIAKKMALPLDIIVTRKIGAPLNPEYAIAAVSSNKVVLSGHEEVDRKYLEEQITKERLEIERRQREYRGNKPTPNFQGKIVVLVDDGLATGLTMQVTIEEVKMANPKKIIIALPVAPPESLEKLKTMVDKIVILCLKPLFFAVGQFYENFNEVTDAEVKALLQN